MQESRLGENAAQPTLVEGVVGVRFEEEVLQPDHDGVQIEDGFPVFAEDVEADVAFEVEVRVVHLWDAFHLGRLVRVVVVDRKGELESAAFVHACAGSDEGGRMHRVSTLQRVDARGRLARKA